MSAKNCVTRRSMKEQRNSKGFLANVTNSPAKTAVSSNEKSVANEKMPSNIEKLQNCVYRPIHVRLERIKIDILSESKLLDNKNIEIDSKEKKSVNEMKITKKRGRPKQSQAIDEQSSGPSTSTSIPVENVLSVKTRSQIRLNNSNDQTENALIETNKKVQLSKGRKKYTKKKPACSDSIENGTNKSVTVESSEQTKAVSLTIDNGSPVKIKKVHQKKRKAHSNNTDEINEADGNKEQTVSNNISVGQQAKTSQKVIKRGDVNVLVSHGQTEEESKFKGFSVAQLQTTSGENEQNPIQTTLIQEDEEPDAKRSRSDSGSEKSSVVLHSLNVNDDAQSNASSSDNSPNATSVHPIFEDVLKKEYLNVSKRMNVSLHPKCLNNLELCIQHHRKDFKMQYVDFDEVSKLRILLRTEKPILFLWVVNNMTIRKKFPNKTVIFMLLEHILTINDPPDDEYTAKIVIEKAAFTFAKILESFPPCSTQCKSTYKEIIIDPIGNETVLPKDKFNVNIGFLTNILNMLENIIQEGRLDNAVDDNLNETEDFGDFSAWNKKNRQKYSFEQLDRKEKVGRVFLVLNLLIQLMEADLTMWMLVYANQYHEKIFKQKNKLPLIAYFLWPNGDIGEINFHVTNILDLFTKYISIDFSSDKLAIIARLVNVMFNCVNICDASPSCDIEYPNIGNRTTLFADALNKKIQGNQSYSAQLYCNVIKHIRSPILKLLISTKIINKLTHHKIDITPNFIYKQLQEENYFNLEEENDATNEQMDSPGINSSQHYPCIPKKNNHRGTFTLEEKEYIEILLTSLESYLETYHIREVAINLKNKHTYKYDADPCSQYANDQNDIDNQKHIPIDYSALKAKDDEILARGYNCVIYPNNIVDKQLLPAIELSIDQNRIDRIREDIKYYDFIIKAAENANNGYFTDWIEGHNM